MSAFSILCPPDGEPCERSADQDVDLLFDLNLDQIIAAVTLGKEEYDLAPVFGAPLRKVDEVRYRQEVMRDLEDTVTSTAIKDFAGSMRRIRQSLGLVEKLFHGSQKERWFLDAAKAYCDAVVTLENWISGSDVRSRGLAAFRSFLQGYVTSDAFRSLAEQAELLCGDLAEIRYCVLIKGSTVRVRAYEQEADYSVEIEKTFSKFRQGAAKDYRLKSREDIHMNHVEEEVVSLVARLWPDLFARLKDFRLHNAGFLDETIRRFDREVQFYVSWLDFLSPFRQAGLPFCYPRVSAAEKDVVSREGFDLALAIRLQAVDRPIVRNDFFLSGVERFLVVSGPNQGGKTTFARAFGQIHYLASLGCHVPGTEARLFLYDQMFSHFEREESNNGLHGKLQHDLVRMREILERATPRSMVILNEIFGSTTLADALFLGKFILERLLELDLLGIYVTFLDELAALSEKTVSMVSTVVPDNPSQRTFKVLRRPADGLAYALSVAEKHRLTYRQLTERMAR